MADEPKSTLTETTPSSSRSYQPLQEGYTPTDDRGYQPSATSQNLPAPPAGCTGETTASSSDSSSNSSNISSTQSSS